MGSGGMRPMAVWTLEMRWNGAASENAHGPLLELSNRVVCDS